MQLCGNYREANRVADSFAHLGHTHNDFGVCWFEEALPEVIRVLVRNDFMQTIWFR